MKTTLATCFILIPVIYQGELYCRGWSTIPVSSSPTSLKSSPERFFQKFVGSESALSVASSSVSTSDVDSINRGRNIGLASDEWLRDYFHSDIDDVNVPPSLNIIRRSFRQLQSGSDIRGRFVDHPTSSRSMSSVAYSIGQTSLPALTPFAAHMIGFGFATMLKEEENMIRTQTNNVDTNADRDPTAKNQVNDEEIVICIGRDPRSHGTILADAFARGAGGVPNVKVVYTGIATTPAMLEFCRSSLCHGSVMVTASHLPLDRNGFKFFSRTAGGFSKLHIQRMVDLARDHSQVWFDMGTIPPRSGGTGVFASEFVNWMPHYEKQLKATLINQVLGTNVEYDHYHDIDDEERPLAGLKIVLNSGNGSGGFFREVLDSLGANVQGSIHTSIDENFPYGVPNPETSSMISETIEACERSNADLGILLDTDADRCGMVAPRSYSKLTGESGSSFVPTNYEPLNRNRLIALMGVIYSRQAPGCAIVTDSVTSNGLSRFLGEELGLDHVRYVRGYAHVIAKAKALIEQGKADAQVAIETSGHCAVRENDFVDDGIFTAIKVLGLLAEERYQEKEVEAQRRSPLDLISALEEHEEVAEFRLNSFDETIESTRGLFDFVALEIELACAENDAWAIDRTNLEGIRVSLSDGQHKDDEGFFLIRKSLHDPVICLQVEARSKKDARGLVVEPLLRLLRSEPRLRDGLDLSDLSNYAEMEC